MILYSWAGLNRDAQDASAQSINAFCGHVNNYRKLLASHSISSDVWQFAQNTCLRNTIQSFACRSHVLFDVFSGFVKTKICITVTSYSSSKCFGKGKSFKLCTIHRTRLYSASWTAPVSILQKRMLNQSPTRRNEC